MSLRDKKKCKIIFRKLSCSLVSNNLNTFLILLQKTKIMLNKTLTDSFYRHQITHKKV